MGKSGGAPATGARRRVAPAWLGFSVSALVLALSTAGCPGGYNGLGPIPVEAGEHVDQDDAQAGDAVARDSGALDPDSGTHDSATPHRADAIAEDSAATEHDAATQDSAVAEAA